MSADAAILEVSLTLIDFHDSIQKQLHMAETGEGPRAVDQMMLFLYFAKVQASLHLALPDDLITPTQTYLREYMLIQNGQAKEVLLACDVLFSAWRASYKAMKPALDRLDLLIKELQKANKSTS